MTAAMAHLTAPPAVESFFATLGADPLSCAFPRKGGARAGGPMAPLPEAQLEAEGARLMAPPRNRRAVAYLHIPFCENHCLFCGFYQNACPGDPDARPPADRRPAL